MLAPEQQIPMAALFTIDAAITIAIKVIPEQSGKVEY
jgi:hypothetical protein